MKLLNYFAAALAFSISAVSFEFSKNHHDYVKNLEPEDRSFVVLGLLALEEKYGDSTDYDASTLSTNPGELNALKRDC